MEANFLRDYLVNSGGSNLSPLLPTFSQGTLFLSEIEEVLAALSR